MTAVSVGDTYRSHVVFEPVEFHDDVTTKGNVTQVLPSQHESGEKLSETADAVTIDNSELTQLYPHGHFTHTASTNANQTCAFSSTAAQLQTLTAASRYPTTFPLCHYGVIGEGTIATADKKLTFSASGTGVTYIGAAAYNLDTIGGDFSCTVWCRMNSATTADIFTA